MSDAARKYSKLKAIAGHVVWTDQETWQQALPFEGCVYDGAQFGVFKVVGRDLLLRGIRVDARVPSNSANVNTRIQFLTGANVEVPDVYVNLPGVSTFGEITDLNVKLPSGSYWKAQCVFDPAFQAFAPQSLVITYEFSYANGIISNALAAYDLAEQGIGYWIIGDDFVVS